VLLQPVGGIPAWVTPAGGRWHGACTFTMVVRRTSWARRRLKGRAWDGTSVLDCVACVPNAREEVGEAMRGPLAGVALWSLEECVHSKALGCARRWREPLSPVDVREMLFFVPSCNTDQGVYQLGKRSGGKPPAHNESDTEVGRQRCPHYLPTLNLGDMFEL